MTKFYLISLLIIAFSCGLDQRSALKQEESNPENAVISYESDQWPISCYFYDPSSKDLHKGLPLWNHAWVWAKTADGAHVHAKGQIQGGFLPAEAIYYSKGKKVGSLYIDAAGEELMPEIKTQADMQNFCQGSIDRYYPGKGYKLIGMVASRSVQLASNFTYNAIPLVVGEKEATGATRLVVFGDSLSDTGRLKKWMQIMPERPFFAGRFSNGAIYVDFLGDEAHLGVLNYSTGGAVTKPNITSTVKQVTRYVSEVGRFFITSSIRNFVTDYRQAELVKGKVPEADKTLFILWGGANDFLSKFDTAEDINTFIDNPDIPGVGSNSIIDQTVLNVMQEVRGLAAIGALKIVVANLPDIGITPRMAADSLFRDNSSKDKYIFASKLSEIITDYNNKLAKAINKLNISGTKIILFDAAQVLKDLMAGQSSLSGFDMQASFENLYPPSKDLKAIKIGRKCYSGSYLGSTKAGDICSNPSKMLFWDEVHPTSAGHCGLAYALHELVYNAGFVSAAPKISNYKSLCGPR